MTGIIPHPLSVEHFVGPALASSMESPLGETSILTTNTSLDRDAEKTKRLSKDPITTSSKQRPTKANGWVQWLFFPHSSSAGVLSHMCSNVLCAVCERAQGTGNEDRWGSFKEPGFTNREVSWSSSSPCSLREAEQPRHRRPALQDSATCAGNFMPWRPRPPLANPYHWDACCGCRKQQDNLLRV